MSDPSKSQTTLKCECCSWSGPEADLEADFACPQCGERVWADQTVPQQTTPCQTCQGEARILYLYDRGPGSPPGNQYVGCPDCEAGREYDAKLRAEIEAGIGRSAR